MPDYSDGALRALFRNALAAERGPMVVSPLRRQVSRAAPPPEIADDVRAAYADELAEREAVHVYAGLPEFCNSKLIGVLCCARHAALQELGCVEFYSYEPRAGASVKVNSLPRGEVIYPGIRAALRKWSELGPREVLPRSPSFSAADVGPLDRTLLCSRCESVGHLVEACPFAATDADVLRIAAAHRARRRERAA